MVKYSKILVGITTTNLDQLKIKLGAASQTKNFRSVNKAKKKNKVIINNKTAS